MTSIVSFMTQDHRHCDDIFAATESQVAENNWDQAASQWSIFCHDLETHLGREESLLFPAFESKTGSTQGPTAVMRMEHTQMRGLIEDMNAAVSNRDSDGFLGLAETLMILMQQHNMKEEQILYPMSDQVLSGAELVQQMSQG